MLQAGYFSLLIIVLLINEPLPISIKTYAILRPSTSNIIAPVGFGDYYFTPVNLPWGILSVCVYIPFILNFNISPGPSLPFYYISEPFPFHLVQFLYFLAFFVVTLQM